MWRLAMAFAYPADRRKSAERVAERINVQRPSRRYGLVDFLLKPFRHVEERAKYPSAVRRSAVEVVRMSNLTMARLPALAGVQSYELRYKTRTSWSELQTVRPEQWSTLPTGVIGIAFIPLDAAGRPVAVDDEMIAVGRYPVQGDTDAPKLGGGFHRGDGAAHTAAAPSAPEPALHAS